MSKKKGRVVCGILYPENSEHRKVIANLSKYEAVYILHDKDLYEKEDDELQKKEHWHFLIRFNNARYIEPICEEIGLKETNLLRKCESLRGYLKYMIHHGYDDKHQYSIDDIKGSKELKYTLKKAINIDDKDEELRVVQITDFILNNPERVSLTDVINFCITNGLWADFRRCSTVWKDLIKEHNDSLI